MTGGNEGELDFAQLIASRERSGVRVTYRVGADWQHGRTLFGGLVAAFAACAIRDVAGPARPLRALQVAFVGPVPAGVLSVDVDVLRDGRAVTQVRAVAHAGDGTGCHVLAVLGDARASALPVSAARRPPARDVERQTGLAVDDLALADAGELLLSLIHI